MDEKGKMSLDEAYKSGLLEPGGCDDDIASAVEQRTGKPVQQDSKTGEEPDQGETAQ